MCADALTVSAELCKALLQKGLQIPVVAFDEIDSTNSYAKKMAQRGEPCALVVAMGQTQGRGRMGRTFYSPAGSGLYFSLLYTLDTPMCNAVSLTCAAAVAVRRAVDRVCHRQTDIKWVNDLYYKGKKVCGVLAESVLSLPDRPSLVIGIGLNLRTAEFPPDLADIAGTLGADEADASELIAAIVEELMPHLQNPASRAWIDDYRAFSCVLGKRVRWISGGESAEGVAEEIEGDGALVVRADCGERIALRTGEITLRLC